MRIAETSDLWWKNAVIYCLDVETFFDDDGDGTGDFAGLTQRVDYLSALGVTCIWLMPFYPSPDRDDGYDVTDFFGVDSRLGTLGDFVEFIRAAKDRGMRVIADFVVNHTSDQHPWFVEARKSTDNPYRDYYVWRKDTPPDTSSEVVFPGEETSLWTKDDATGEWYLHMFAKHQPDLNVTNPKVRNEIVKAMGLWLELGLDGFRLDAVPFFLETRGAPNDEAANLDPHNYLSALRSFVNRRNGSAILLGEVNLPYKEQLEYFGTEGSELNMQFDFMSMQHLYLSLARQDARPLAETLKSRPALHPDNQWAMFVRNHDELTLDKISDGERQEVFAAFGPEKNMQIYGRGLRRRLPTMLGGDQERIRMVYSLMFTLPGTPVLFYGEEIGMGEDLRQKGRSAVRSPMQWSDAKNGGFSSAKVSELIAPMVRGDYGPDKVNAAAAKRDPDSLWNFMATLMQRYRESPELGWGEFSVLDQPEPGVFAHKVEADDGTLVLLHNFTEEPVKISATVAPADEETQGRRARNPYKGCILLDLLDGDHLPLEPDGTFTVKLGRYGYKWYRVHEPGDRLAP
ncbi:alpha-amylase family protein [Pseudarthrobacter sp. J75]|uniref:alpha-amylase family protein n=1 Tax=unclassified Pseudarthrobacter TaxID=2647000 RepID=UPI002E81FD08|nr:MULTISPECIES: alpha-amylase family protein [unclassified Pseudarthrobacter]MEE2523629.1 alpha-amylase family protein [Pseudarthrobacter sp. J47]MEE2530019.1 alpha-amylase family protein [Pseudarthrobacter sp. J75]